MFIAMNMKTVLSVGNRNARETIKIYLIRHPPLGMGGFAAILFG